MGCMFLLAVPADINWSTLLLERRRAHFQTTYRIAKRVKLDSTSSTQTPILASPVLRVLLARMDPVPSA